MHNIIGKWKHGKFLSKSVSVSQKIKNGLWIELPWPENPANIYAWHTETLDNCFDLIRFHQQFILLSPRLEIEPATTECKAKTLPLSYQFTSCTSDAKLTSHSGRWFDLQWRRSRYTLLMRPNKVETAVQCFRMSRASVRRIFWS